MIMDVSRTRCAMWAVAIGLFLGLIGVLSGCDNHVDTHTVQGNLEVFRQDVGDGHSVLCARDRSYGSISCDWGHAK